MALKEGFSQEVIGSNIRELVRSGRDPKEAVALSLSEARRHRKLSPAPIEAIAPAASAAPAAEAIAEALAEAPISVEPVMPAPAALSPGLDAAAQKAIMERKKKRVFIQ